VICAQDTTRRCTRSATAAPEGGIDLQEDQEEQLPADEASLISGWALLPSEPVARVEVTVDGRAVGRARPAVARPDLVETSARADAGLSGFELWLQPEDIAEGAEQITLGARVVGINGTVFRLAKNVPLARVGAESGQAGQESADGYPEKDVASLRQRVQDVVSASGHVPTCPPRLLVFSHQLGYGGAQLFMTEILSIMRAETGLECVVVSFGDGPLRELLESIGIAVQVIDANNRQNSVVYEGQLLELAAWAAPQGFNIVMVNTVDPFLGVDLAERLGIPAVWFVHESYDPAVWCRFAFGTTRIYAWDRMRRAMRSAAAVVFEAERTRQLYLDYASAERLVTAPYGLVLDEIDRYIEHVDRRQLRRQLDIAEEATVVLCLGTIEPRKGQTALAIAFAELAERFPNAVLLLVGETDQDWLAHVGEELRRFVARAGLESRMLVLPLTPDPYQWFAVADVYVMPSDIESLPRVALEAMAFGLPVVATSIFGLADLIEDGRTGYLCEARDIRALRDTLARVLASDPEERQAIGRAAAECVHRDHDARRYSRWTARYLQSLIADPRAVPSEVMHQ
jgi:D-inositol-3-phosphate glycosyltransferase